ncbi:protein translocase SEC61 complex subunit gamma [Candidatus Pacearchaeota archaeon]|nr:protein translocase SEC61 complex subunit gamma [Candidatus Pacearchaeota archaeon]
MAFGKFKEFVGKCVRVFNVAKKPTKNELKQVSKISALGILAIGLLGFIIGIIFTILFY